MAKDTTNPPSKNKKPLIPEAADLSAVQPKPLSESLKRIGDLAKDWEEGPRLNSKETHAEPRQDVVIPKANPQPTVTVPRTGINWSKWATFTGILLILLLGAQTAFLNWQTMQNRTAISQAFDNMNKKMSLIQEKVEALPVAEQPGRVELNEVTH
jgi:hypothetical protein